jgi:hypothetical protein
MVAGHPLLQSIADYAVEGVEHGRTLRRARLPMNVFDDVPTR